MIREEAKQYLRNQIDSSLKSPSGFDNDIYYLSYNNSYVRVLKLSTITGNPVNQENFKGGDTLFRINTNYKEFWYYSKIWGYLKENYSKEYSERLKLLEDILNEYEEYKGYKCYAVW